MNDALKAPFPWFGGKAKVAAIVWDRFGPVRNYVEPFAGSLAVLLGNPCPEALAGETANDLNGWLCNAWRGIAFDPDGTAEAADWPVSELDLHARGDALFYPETHAAGLRLYEAHGGLPGFIAKLRADPLFHDAQIAGWWLWGLSSWIGDNWGRVAHNAKKVDGIAVGVVGARPHLSRFGTGVHRQNLARKLPHLGDYGKGVNRQNLERKRPHLSSGTGVNRQQLDRQRPCLGDYGKGVNRGTAARTCDERREMLLGYFGALADRLRRTRVCCGEWGRVTGPCVTGAASPCGVFLDPPYHGQGETRDNVYGAEETDCWAAVCDWCRENGPNRDLRIALCGYEGGWQPPPGWSEVPWKTGGGYGNQAEANGNRHRERIWFSPGCVTRQPGLFDTTETGDGQ